MAADVKALNLAKTKDLLDDPYSCLHVVTQTRQIHLPSYLINDVLQGIKSILDVELKRYSSRLEGNALAYENIRLSHNTASIMEDLPYVLLDATVDFFVFRPHLGSTLRGKVNKISRDHIGCVVLDQFNASVLKPPDEEAWQSPLVKLGMSVLLEVTALNVVGKVTLIRGKLLEIEDGEGAVGELMVDDDGYASQSVPSLPSVSSTEDVFQKPMANYKRPVNKKYFTDDSDNDSVASATEAVADATLKERGKKCDQDESPKKRAKSSRSRKSDSGDRPKRQKKDPGSNGSDSSTDLFITQTPTHSGLTASGESSSGSAERADRKSRKKKKKNDDLLPVSELNYNSEGDEVSSPGSFKVVLQSGRDIVGALDDSVAVDGQAKTGRKSNKGKSRSPKGTKAISPSHSGGSDSAMDNLGSQVVADGEKVDRKVKKKKSKMADDLKVTVPSNLDAGNIAAVDPAPGGSTDGPSVDNATAGKSKKQSADSDASGSRSSKLTKTVRGKTLASKKRSKLECGDLCSEDVAWLKSLQDWDGVLTNQSPKKVKKKSEKQKKKDESKKHKKKDESKKHKKKDESKKHKKDEPKKRKRKVEKTEM